MSISTHLHTEDMIVVDVNDGFQISVMLDRLPGRGQKLGLFVTL